MEVVLIISPKLVLERTTAHTNLDEKLIFPEIKAAQDMYIRPMLGSVLFDKIIADISADDLAGDYLDIWERFLVDAVCNYVLSETPEGLNYQFWNKGLTTKTTEDSTSPSMQEMYAIVRKYKNRAEHYTNACRLYIIQNITKFPEYYAPGGIDRVQPDRSSFTLPIYLDDCNFDRRYGRANRNPRLNSNDPSYYE